MQDRPKFQLVDIVRIVGWILDDARDHRPSLDRNLPSGKAPNPDHKSQEAADRQHPERPISMGLEERRELHRSVGAHTSEYFVVRLIANGLSLATERRSRAEPECRVRL